MDAGITWGTAVMHTECSNVAKGVRALRQALHKARSAPADTAREFCKLSFLQATQR